VPQLQVNKPQRRLLRNHNNLGSRGLSHSPSNESDKKRKIRAPSQITKLYFDHSFPPREEATKNKKTKNTHTNSNPSTRTAPRTKKSVRTVDDGFTKRNDGKTEKADP